MFFAIRRLYSEERIAPKINDHKLISEHRFVKAGKSTNSGERNVTACAVEN